MRQGLLAVALLAASAAGCTGPPPAGPAGGLGPTTAVRLPGERQASRLPEGELPVIVANDDGFMFQPGPAFAEFPLRRREVLEGPGAGTAYRYGEAPATIDVYVSPRPPGESADDAVAYTLDALEELGRRGTVGEVTVVEDTTVILEGQWEGADPPVRHVFMHYLMQGELHHSHLFLLEDGAEWVKVRASYPAGLLSDAALYYAALGYLAGEDFAP